MRRSLLHDKASIGNDQKLVERLPFRIQLLLRNAPHQCAWDPSEPMGPVMPGHLLTGTSEPQY